MTGNRLILIVLLWQVYNGSSHMPADALPDEDLQGTTNLEPGSGLQSASSHENNKPHSVKEELQVVILQIGISF